MYGCPSCGAGLIFNPKTQMLKCDYCNQEYNIERFEKNVKTSKVEKDLYNAISYRCTQCGAELLTTDETIATFCSYCGSSVILERTDVNRRIPDYIIPFIKTKEECQEAYRKRIKNAFLAPSEMKKNQEIEKIRGIYVPYWIYSYEKKELNYTQRNNRKNR